MITRSSRSGKTRSSTQENQGHWGTEMASLHCNLSDRGMVGNRHVPGLRKVILESARRKLTDGMERCETMEGLGFYVLQQITTNDGECLGYGTCKKMTLYSNKVKWRRYY